MVKIENLNIKYKEGFELHLSAFSTASKATISNPTSLLSLFPKAVRDVM